MAVEMEKGVNVTVLRMDNVWEFNLDEYRLFFENGKLDWNELFLTSRLEWCR